MNLLHTFKAATEVIHMERSRSPMKYWIIRADESFYFFSVVITANYNIFCILASVVIDISLHIASTRCVLCCYFFLLHFFDRDYVNCYLLILNRKPHELLEFVRYIHRIIGSNFHHFISVIRRKAALNSRKISQITVHIHIL